MTEQRVEPGARTASGSVPPGSEERPFLARVADDWTDLRDTLRYMVAAASDTDRNMRDDSGACLDCGQTVDEGHDDPDCGMAGLHAVAQDARRLLRGLRVPPPGRTTEQPCIPSDPHAECRYANGPTPNIVTETWHCYRSLTPTQPEPSGEGLREAREALQRIRRRVDGEVWSNQWAVGDVLRIIDAEIEAVSHACTESCLHDCPECGHEVDHTSAFHAPACAATPSPERQEQEAVRLLHEIWESVPATYDPDDPMVQRHAQALNAAGQYLAALSQPEQPKGGPEA